MQSPGPGSDIAVAATIARSLGADAVRQFQADRPQSRAHQRPAAVLLGIVDHPDAPPGVLLTRRASHLRHHPGQISFPGGRMEPGETDPAQTALRESREEIDLPSQKVEIVGRLGDYVTVTGFRVAPVVGVITPPLALTPNPSEVDAIFEAPLAFLMDPNNHRHIMRDMGGVQRPHLAIPYGDHYIWGATAGILMTFYEVLRRAIPSAPTCDPTACDPTACDPTACDTPPIDTIIDGAFSDAG